MFLIEVIIYLFLVGKSKYILVTVFHWIIFFCKNKSSMVQHSFVFLNFECLSHIEKQVTLHIFSEHCIDFLCSWPSRMPRWTCLRTLWETEPRQKTIIGNRNNFFFFFLLKVKFILLSYLVLM